MDSANEEAQNDEILAMEAILDHHSFSIVQTRTAEKPTSGQLRIDFQFPSGFKITASILKEDSTIEELSHTLYHLPPLLLHFILPIDYPLISKPVFTLSSTWMDRNMLSKLCRALDEIWANEKGSVVLFSWYTFLNDALSYLKIGVTEFDFTWCCAPNRTKKLKLTKTEKEILDHRAVFERRIEPILDYLIEFNEEEAERVFQIAPQNCSICISDKTGKDCIRFPRCGHVFCKGCISEFFKTLITEGNLDGVKCPSFKCDVTPDPTKVKEIVGDELFERYDRLLLKRTLEGMSDIVTCPLQKCQCPVLTDANDKLARCPQCSYVFCSSCFAVYHGVEPCRFKTNDRKVVYEQYTKGSIDDRKQLEKAYGKKQLEVLVQTVLSEKWVASRSKPCPHCSVPIEKFEGCNKVTCFKCNSYFCWICSVQLDPLNPYLHFNDPNSKCFDSLFLDLEGVAESDEDEIDDWLDLSEDEGEG